METPEPAFLLDFAVWILFPFKFGSGKKKDISFVNKVSNVHLFCINIVPTKALEMFGHV